MASNSNSMIPPERIEKAILYIRKHKVMLDRDLAALYNVETRTLNQAVKRNIERFPSDFMFQLTKKEREQLITNCDRFNSLKHANVLPFVFTEQGIAMLSSVLRSPQAVEVNIAIMRTFVKLRQILNDNALLRRKIESMERKYDEQFQEVFAILQQMLIDDSKPKRQIGYHTEAKGAKRKTKKAVKTKRKRY